MESGEIGVTDKRSANWGCFLGLTVQFGERGAEGVEKRGGGGWEEVCVKKGGKKSSGVWGGKKRRLEKIDCENCGLKKVFFLGGRMRGDCHILFDSVTYVFVFDAGRVEGCDEGER